MYSFPLNGHFEWESEVNINFEYVNTNNLPAPMDDQVVWVVNHNNTVHFLQYGSAGQEHHQAALSSSRHTC